jgi:DNA mismatch repair protein PMS2
VQLHLPVDEEMIIVDNIEVFKKNGFDFETDEFAALTQRVKLTAMPFSKHNTFGVEGNSFKLF